MASKQLVAPLTAEYIGHHSARSLAQQIGPDFNALVAERLVHSLNSSGNQGKALRIVGDFGVPRAELVGHESRVNGLIVRPSLTAE